MFPLPGIVRDVERTFSLPTGFAGVVGWALSGETRASITSDGNDWYYQPPYRLHCPRCGAFIELYDTYCWKCGYRLRW